MEIMQGKPDCGSCPKAKHFICDMLHARLCRRETHVATDTTGKLWHKRLSHMSQKGMQMLAEKELLLEVRNMHMEKCIDCLAGKQNKVAFALGL